MTRTVRYLALICIIGLWGSLILPYDFFPKKTPTFLESAVRLISPGILFSLYLVLIFKSVLTAKCAFLDFAILISFYVFSVYICLQTWGLLTPIAGGIGAVIVKRLFRMRTSGYMVFGLGFLTSGLGLVVFFTNDGKYTAGALFGVIIALWQIALGHLSIIETKFETAEISSDIVKQTDT